MYSNTAARYTDAPVPTTDLAGRQGECLIRLIELNAENPA